MDSFSFGRAMAAAGQQAAGQPTFSQQPSMMEQKEAYGTAAEQLGKLAVEQSILFNKAAASFQKPAPLSSPKFASANGSNSLSMMEMMDQQPFLLQQLQQQQLASIGSPSLPSSSGPAAASQMSDADAELIGLLLQKQLADEEQAKRAEESRLHSLLVSLASSASSQQPNKDNLQQQQQQGQQQQDISSSARILEILGLGGGTNTTSNSMYSLQQQQQQQQQAQESMLNDSASSLPIDALLGLCTTTTDQHHSNNNSTTSLGKREPLTTSSVPPRPVKRSKSSPALSSNFAVAQPQEDLAISRKDPKTIFPLPQLKGSDHNPSPGGLSLFRTAWDAATTTSCQNNKNNDKERSLSTRRDEHFSKELFLRSLYQPRRRPRAAMTPRGP